MATTDTTTEDRAAARRAYRRVLRIVAYNTNNRCQGPLATHRAVLTTATHAGIDGQTARNAIRQAVSNDDLLGIEREGTRYVAPVDDDALRRVIEEVALREPPSDSAESDERPGPWVPDSPPDKGLVAECNRLMDTIQENGGT